MNTTELIIGIFPDAETEVKLIEESQKAKEFGNDILLGARPGDLRVHLSIFHFLCQEKNVPYIGRMLHDQLGARESIQALTTTKKVLGDKWLFIESYKEERLFDLQKSVIEIVKPFRNGKVSISWKMTKKQEEMHQELGDPNVLDCFNPHFTCGLLDSSKVPSRLKEGVFFQMPWTANYIFVAEKGEHGTVSEVFYLFPLQPSKK